MSSFSWIQEYVFLVCYVIETLFDNSHKKKNDTSSIAKFGQEKFDGRFLLAFGKFKARMCLYNKNYASCWLAYEC